LFVVALLAGVAGFTLWGELKTNNEVDTLVSRALARDVIMSGIRVDALNLESAVAAHIQAKTDGERAEADERMESILTDIGLATEDYTRDLPPSEAESWSKFKETSHALAKQVRKAVTYSNRREAERARTHLVSEIRPITATLDGLAERLSQGNADVTTGTLRRLQDLHLRTLYLGALVAALAIVLSLLVAWQVTAVLKRQENTIRFQLGELDRRNRELDSFASRVAHDLLSPISPLKGYLTLIRRSKALTNPQVIEMLAQAESSTIRATEMIEALLRFCRAGRPPGDPTISELDTAVSTILLEVGQTASKEGVKLERYLEQHVPVACPLQLLQSIAQNLLSNAVKYTAGRPAPRVRVHVRKEAGAAVLEVEDNGMGMSEQVQESLFQPFFRAPEVRGVPGHGLGMATTKRLVDAYGGTIIVRSKINVGTTVAVRFSLARPLPPEVAPSLPAAETNASDLLDVS
jgi:signal transduction histidine kinase